MPLATTPRRCGGVVLCVSAVEDDADAVILPTPVTLAAAHDDIPGA